MPMILAALLGFTLAHATFLDPKDIRNLPAPGITNGVTEAEFNDRIAYVRQVYNPVFESFGGRLKLRAKWKSNTLNARASQFLNSWMVEITGGLARHPELTLDGMTLIVCHEIGHHLGGFPFDGGSMLTGNWAATEGQSDYYSTHVCARRLWKNDLDTNASFRNTIPATGMNKCDQVFTSQDERDLCYRIVAASLSVTNTMTAILKKPEPARLETPDPTVRETTLITHPKTQCRLDTLFQGSICAAHFGYAIIPGKKVRHKESLEAETESAKVSCSQLSQFTDGLRPACWFKARL